MEGISRLKNIVLAINSVMAYLLYDDLPVFDGQGHLINQSEALLSKEMFDIVFGIKQSYTACITGFYNSLQTGLFSQFVQKSFL